MTVPKSKWGDWDVSFLETGSWPWKLSGEKPWVCEDEDTRGLLFVVPDWDFLRGEWVVSHIGVNLADLIDGFIDVESVRSKDDTEELLRRRQLAISALEAAIETLRTEPFRNGD